MLLEIKKALDDGSAALDRLAKFRDTIGEYRKFLERRQKDMQDQIAAEFKEIDAGLASLSDATLAVSKLVEGGNGKSS